MYTSGVGSYKTRSLLAKRIESIAAKARRVAWMSKGDVLPPSTILGLVVTSLGLSEVVRSGRRGGRYGTRSAGLER